MTQRKKTLENIVGKGKIAVFYIIKDKIHHSSKL